MTQTGTITDDVQESPSLFQSTGTLWQALTYIPKREHVALRRGKANVMTYARIMSTEGMRHRLYPLENESWHLLARVMARAQDTAHKELDRAVDFKRCHSLGEALASSGLSEKRMKRLLELELHGVHDQADAGREEAERILRQLPRTSIQWEDLARLLLVKEDIYIRPRIAEDYFTTCYRLNATSSP